MIVRKIDIDNLLRLPIMCICKPLRHLHLSVGAIKCMLPLPFIKVHLLLWATLVLRTQGLTLVFHILRDQGTQHSFAVYNLLPYMSIPCQYFNFHQGFCYPFVNVISYAYFWFSLFFLWRSSRYSVGQPG